jgi:hypothetical protein
VVVRIDAAPVVIVHGAREARRSATGFLHVQPEHPAV